MRQIFTALFCIALTVNALAADVTKNNAAKVATNYFSEVISNGANPVISESFDLTKDGNTTLYVFNFENGGYVVVSADNRFTPIVGYSPNGYYEEGNMADGFEFLMWEFSEMIAFIREKDIAAEPEYVEKWERYQSDSPTRGITEVIVAPMTALWDQGSPYNYYCPAAPGGQGGKAWAGCVATAMSIIMYYWRWPLQGVGERAYNPTNNQFCPGVVFPNLHVKFDEAYYDYNGMWGHPTLPASNYFYEPIALLQYHAGVSVRMMYCGDGSGAYSVDVPVSMKNHFKYDPSIKHVQKNNTTTAQWGAMLKEQLDLKQPVYSSGQSPSGGHAFVCDGYDSNDMFHYNFGWSGSSNGYFIADKPDEYTSGVAVVSNFIPDRGQGYPVNGNGNWTIPYMRGTIADCSGPIDKYAAGTTATWLIDPSVYGDAIEKITINCLEMDLAAGDYLRFYDGPNDSAPLLKEATGNAIFTTVTSTGGKMLVKFTSAANSATAQGFMITYEATPKKYCDPANAVTFTTASGSFTDGSPEGWNYPNSSGSCKWNIYPDGAVPDTKITFKFKRLDTEAGSDLIRFYDAVTAKLIATHSGTYGPEDELPTVVVESIKATVTFSSNTYINGEGFELEYFTDPVSIKEIENINDLSIYPNPASDKLNIKFNTSTADNFDIVIYNVTGQVVYKETLNNFLGSYYNELNINDFAQGVYLMQIKSSKGATTRKVVIQ